MDKPIPRDYGPANAPGDDMMHPPAKLTARALKASRKKYGPSKFSAKDAGDALARSRMKE